MKKKLKLQHFITLTRRISKLKPAVLHWSVLLDPERTEFAWIFPSQLWLYIVSIFKVYLLFFNFQHGWHFSNKWVRDFIIWFRIQCGHEGQSNIQYSCLWWECQAVRDAELASCMKWDWTDLGMLGSWKYAGEARDFMNGRMSAVWIRMI